MLFQHQKQKYTQFRSSQFKLYEHFQYNVWPQLTSTFSDVKVGESIYIYSLIGAVAYNISIARAKSHLKSNRSKFKTIK